MSNPHDHSDSGSEYIDPEEENEYGRPNRWKGAPSTWQTLTAQERALAASLDQIRNADLSVHLYNAHALKQRAQILSANPDDPKLRNEYPEVALEDQIFKPPKVWTAWPLPPDEIPREGDAMLDDGNENYTYKLKEGAWPSRQLEDVLVGVTLKFAKGRFEGRESANESDDSARRQRAKGGRKNLVNLEEDEDEILSVDDMVPIITAASRAPPPKKIFRPVVSADDDRSRVILRPSIRDTLSKLDNLLMALHSTRKACRRFSQSEPNTDDETIAGSVAGDSGSPSKQAKGRPRKFANLTDRSVIPQSIEQNPNDPALFRTKKTHRGRPQKVYPRLDGETQREYLIRIARIQKKPLPPFAPSEPMPKPSPERVRRSPIRRATDEQLRNREHRTLGLRDWSEVLGSAALIGFSEDAIARATQRCANLFGEGMTTLVIPEVPFGEETSFVEKRYQPDLIPELEEEGTSDTDEGTAGSERSGSVSASDLWRVSTKKQKILLHDTQQFFCPVSDCSRKRRGFPSTLALKRHLQQGHEIPADQLDDYILPSDEEMDGAVHVDGFLRPLMKFRTSKGKYKKRRMVEESDRRGKAMMAGQISKVGDEALLSIDEEDSEFEPEGGPSHDDGGKSLPNSEYSADRASSNEP